MENSIDLFLEGAKPTEIQEEIELEIQTPYEFFNATEFIEDLSLTLNVSRDNIKITKRYASSEQSFVSVTILMYVTHNPLFVTSYS